MPNSEIGHDNRTRNAPRGFFPVLAALGPGLVVIGSVMGSGELINTPTQAAKYGFILLWAVILSCVIKYFLQIEIGRFTLAHRVTPFEAFSTLPFPKYRNTSWIGLAYLGVSLPTSLAFAGIIGATGGMMHSLIPLTSADTGYVHSSAGYTSGNTGSILVDNGDGTPGIAPRVGQRVSFGTSKAAYEVLEVTTDPTEHSITLDRPLEAAVAEGATHVRVGTAIFGPRQKPASNP